MKKVALSLVVAAASAAYVWTQSGGATTDDILGAAPPVDEATTGSGSSAIAAAADRASRPGDQPLPVTMRVAPKPLERAPAAVVSEPPPPPAAPPPLPAPPAPERTAARAEPSAPAAPIVATPAPTPVGPAPPSPAAPVAPMAVLADVPLPRPRPAYREPVASEIVTPASMRVASAGRYVDGTYVGPVTDAYYGLIQIEAIVQGGRLTGIKVLRYPSDRRTSVSINRQALPMLRDEVVSAQSADVDIISGATLTSEAFIRSLGAALRKAGA